MHRVQQILNAAAAVLGADANLPTPEVNRVRSLSEEQIEVPALTVNYGADSPDDAQDQSNIASAIEIRVSAYVAGDSETDVLSSLLDIRARSHVALMADMTLGLPFVWHLTYGGADEPFLQQGERMYGSQTSRWTARYLMDSDSPE